MNDTTKEMKEIMLITSKRSEQFWKKMIEANERLAKQLNLMQASFRTANKAFNHYVYCTRTNNWLKRHGLPMRRKGYSK